MKKIQVQLKHQLHPSLRHSIDSMLFSFPRSDNISSSIARIRSKPMHDPLHIRIDEARRSLGAQSVCLYLALGPANLCVC